MFNPFKKREQKPTPPWVKWLMLGALAFAIINHQFRSGEDRPAFEHTTRYLKKGEASLGNIKDKLLPASKRPTIKELEGGSGNPAICGQKARLIYTARIAENTVIDSAEKNKPYVFTLGDTSVMPVFNMSVLGMKPGAKRQVTGAMASSYGLDAFKRNDVPMNSDVTFNIELLAAEPAIAFDAPLRVFDNKPGQGRVIDCGDQAALNLTLWSLEGKKLFSTHEDGKTPFVFTLGKSETSVGLEQGVLGMRVGGSRTLILPPALQKTMHGNDPAFTLPFPKNQTVLIDLETISP